MNPVMVEIQPRPQHLEDLQDADAVVLVNDVQALTTRTLPGCGDDNPYN